MLQPDHRWRNACAVLLTVLSIAASGAFAFQQRPKTSRFDALVVADPSSSPEAATTPVASLPAADHARGAWQGFRAAHGPSWRAYLDRRSGAPLLAFGQGIPWPGAFLNYSYSRSGAQYCRCAADSR